MTNNEIKYQITLDPHSQLTKPPKSAMGKISNNIKLRTGLTIDEFITFVTPPFCFTWFGGTLNGKICKENWEQHSIIALDFDKGLISVEEVIEKLNAEELSPQIWYNTLSDSPELRKFRIVLLLDIPIEVASHYNIIINGLLSFFPEADQSCKDRSRFFLGGKNITILNSNPIPTQKLLNKASMMLINSDGGKTRKIPANLLDHPQSGQKNQFLYSNNRNTHFLPKTTQRLPTSVVGRNNLEINWKTARSRIKILDAFLNGEWLFHDQLFGLATNMMQIKGGRKLMLKTMEKFNSLGITFYTENNFKIFNYLKKVTYPAIPIYQFSTCPEDADLHDIASAVIDQRGYIEIIEQEENIELVEAVKIMKEKFQISLADKRKDKIYLFALPTAIGKTELLTNVNATIAVPTNRLKNEIEGRMKVEYVSAPDAIHFDTDHLNNKLAYYYIIGLPKKAMSVIYDVCSDKNKHKYPLQDIEKAQTYLTQLAKSTNSTNTVLTTHARAIYTEFQHDTIIFDEDPLETIVDIKKFEITELIKLVYQTYTLTSSYNDLIRTLENAEAGVIHSTNVEMLDAEALIEKISLFQLNSNLVGFFSSTFFYKDPYDNNTIHYVTKREFPKNKKIIILSATLPIDLYKALYGDKVEVVDIRNVNQCGEIIQYTKRSCSRTELKRYHESISEEVSDLPVITFMNYRKYFKNAVINMYFGNCEGYDTLNGKDLAVVGTPHRNNVAYYLTAAIIGETLKPEDMEMSLQKVEYNGFRFKFNCYSHKKLRRIQLSLIESDLIQAVGRARSLRTNAKVILYSNFPLKISSKFVY
ncbi:MAG: hypothetical protein ACKOWO_06470 [Sediminibacterium sp.]